MSSFERRVCAISMAEDSGRVEVGLERAWCDNIAALTGKQSGVRTFVAELPRIIPVCVSGGIIWLFPALLCLGLLMSCFITFFVLER